MVRELAVKSLQQRYHPEQVQEYVDLSEQVYGEGYWSQIIDEATLLRDMAHFVESQAMARKEGAHA